MCSNSKMRGSFWQVLGVTLTALMCVPTAGAVGIAGAIKAWSYLMD